jgi:23S rRNA pseudouridine2605 synthase
VTEPGGERLQKVLAHAGVASRRAAEAMIAEGRVAVNGEVVRGIGRRVVASDQISVDGRPITGREMRVYLALNKPINYVSTARDPEGRPTVLDLVPRRERIYPIGRLDWDTEGLLLLTNDGTLANRLMHPRFGVEKEYHALVQGYPDPRALDRLAAGVELEDGRSEPAGVRRLRQDRAGLWLSITIHEGRNRQVRRMLEAIGHPAKRLVRVRLGPIEIGDLPAGRFRYLGSDEVAALQRMTGPASSPPRPRASKAVREVPG